MVAPKLTCPHCDAVLRPSTPVAAGTKIRCKKCEGVITVPYDADEEPKNSAKSKKSAQKTQRNRADDGRDERSAKKGNTGLLIGLAAGGLLLLLVICVGGSVGGYFLFAKRAPNPGPGPNPGAGTPEPVAKGKDPVGEKPPPPLDKKPKPPTDSKPKLDDEPDAPKLEADPLRQPLLPPSDPKGSLNVPGGAGPVRYPRRPGPIAAVMSVAKKKMTGWEVWNLQSMKRLGSVPSSINVEVFLSTDGMYLAKPSGFMWKSVEIYTVADGKLLRTLEVKNNDDVRQMDWIADFAGPGQFLSVEKRAGGGEAKVWDVKTGEQISTFKTAGSVVDPVWSDLSPGGRYLAIYGPEGPKHFVYVYDVTTGKLVRTVHPKLPTLGSCGALTFSYDGNELALLVADDKGTNHIQAWDFATGKRTAEHTFATPLFVTAGSVSRSSRALDWLPDRSGWLAFGKLMIDHKRGNIFWTLPKDDADIAWERRFVDANHYATIVGQSYKQLRLQIIALPKDEIAAARKK